MDQQPLDSDPLLPLYSSPSSSFLLSVCYQIDIFKAGQATVYLLQYFYQLFVSVTYFFALSILSNTVC